MKKYLCGLLILISLLAVTGSLQAQIQSVYLTRGSNAHSIHYFSPTREPADLWLNPYLDEQWKDGHIQFADSIIWYGQLRYDLFRKQMEMIIENDTFYISQPFIVDLIMIGDDYFVYSPYIDKVRKEQVFGSDYFKLLSNPGPAKFLLRNRLRIEESGLAESNLLFGMPSEQKKSFARLTTYYIQLSHEGPAIRIKRKKSQLKKLLADKWAEIEIYSKENKIRYRKVSDIAQLVDYYNTIK